MGSNSQSHYSGRSRASSSRYAAENDPHHNLKTSIQVIGLLICLRLLLPKMFPSEHEPETRPPPRQSYHREQSQQGYGYGRGYANEPPPPPYSRAQIGGPNEMDEIRRIEPAYPASSANTSGTAAADRDRYRDGNVDGTSLDGTTAYGSDEDSDSEYQRERAARRRERRRERERERDRDRRRGSRR